MDLLYPNKSSSKAIITPFLEQSDSNLSGSAPAAPKISRAGRRRALFDLSPYKSLFQRNREMKWNNFIFQYFIFQWNIANSSSDNQWSQIYRFRPKKAVYFEYAEYDTLSTQNPKILGFQFIRGKNFACGAQYLKRVYSGLGYFDRKNLNTTNIYRFWILRILRSLKFYHHCELILLVYNL